MIIMGGESPGGDVKFPGDTHMHTQDSQWTAAASADDGVGAGRVAPLRVDAQRNLEHVLRAAREVFGELGYGAPMEDVARRARVGVGTVYRRFPSKDVLVRRIAEEETARLTEQARTALGQENEAWSALARFLRTSVASGAGRLLPPQVLRVQGPAGTPEAPAAAGAPAVPAASADTAGPAGTPGPAGTAGSAATGGDHAAAPSADEPTRVPQQRNPFAVQAHGAAPGTEHAGREGGGASGQDETGADAGADADAGEQDGIRTLLDVVGQLVDRARGAGELRGDVSVADVLLVIATAAPALPDPAQQAAASARLLDILLEGLRSRPGDRRPERPADLPVGP